MAQRPGQGEHGGYRMPRDRSARAPGIGRDSQRTDVQPIAVPNVGDAQDLTQGDRQKLEAAQHVQRIGRVRPSHIEVPAANPAGATRGGAAPPIDILGLETRRPTEPLTEGLPFGPGSGPEVLVADTPTEDEQEIVLRWLADVAQNQVARDMLNEKRAAKAPPLPPALTESFVPTPIGEELPLRLPLEERSPEETVAEERGPEEELGPETAPEAAAAPPVTEEVPAAGGEVPA